MMKILLIPKIKIHNANALSSPYTIGFPAMTAWLGGVHALQRKLNQREDYKELKFISVGVIVHDFNLHIYKERYTNAIIAARNPLKKDGKPGAFIEEARCHLTVSLIIEYDALKSAPAEDKLPENVTKSLNSGMKFAGGDIMSHKISERFYLDSQELPYDLRRRLMPGHIIIDRNELMKQDMQEKNSDAIEALLKYLQVNNVAKDENEDKKNEELANEKDKKPKIIWKKTRETSGWIVPIAVGFQGLNNPGKASSQRDPDVLHCFAESIVTLGEFIMPYHIKNIDNMLWRYNYDQENQLYICRQKQFFNN